MSMGLQEVIFKASTLIHGAQLLLILDNEPGAVESLLSVEDLLGENVTDPAEQRYFSQSTEFPVKGAKLMELKEIMLIVQGHTNAARTALNSGDEEKCKARLADLSAFLISDGPTPVDDNEKKSEAGNG